jgi:hypothetical protein
MAKPDTVQLRRIQDGFISDPMPREEAVGVMKGYKGVYEEWDPASVLPDGTPLTDADQIAAEQAATKAATKPAE